MSQAKFKHNRSKPSYALSAEETALLTSCLDTEDMTFQIGLNENHVEDGGQNSPRVEIEDGACVDNRCGFWKCKPKSLQYFNNPKALLFFMCCFSAVQGFVVNGLNNANTSTLERRFQLSSSQVGIIISGYDFSAAILGVIVSYLGSGYRKARWLSLGAFFLGFGSFIMAIPHFSTDLYEWGQDVTYSCSVTNATVCNGDASLESYIYVFIFGQLLHGVGGTILYTIGFTLIDDSVPSSSSPFYIGILLTFASLGPALGYVVGGEMLKTYVDFDKMDTSSLELTPSDPRWVGAWWVGYTLSFLIILLIILPLAAYGDELPTAHQVRLTRVSQTHNLPKTTDKTEPEIGSTLRELPAATLVLLRNIPFMCVCLAGASEGIVLSGFSTFMPKFIQNQYGVSAGLASVLAGAVAVPGAAVGQLLGGYLCKRWNLKVQGMLRLAMASCFMVLLFATSVWALCDQPLIAGVTVQYSGNITTDLPLLDDSCNRDCGCNTKYYEPVCSSTDLQFFSPCHAGCLNSPISGSYNNCSCLSSVAAVYQNNSTSVTAGKCSSDCFLMYIFLPAMFFVTLFTFFPSPPAVSATLRCIPEKQRSYALGIKWFIVRFLGSIPGPILFGAVFDNVCSVWGQNCGKDASCWIYDNFGLSLSIFLITLGIKTLSATLFFLAFKFYKPPASEIKRNSLGGGRKFSTETSSVVISSERKCSTDSDNWEQVAVE